MIRALVAARDTGVASLLEHALVRYGFECVLRPDGPAALEACATERFDVVVLDTWLPRKDGLAVAMELRETLHGRGLGILLLNSEPHAAAKKDDALRRGIADAWFEIPFSTSDVRKKLAELALRYTGAVADAMPITGASARRTLKAASPAPAVPVPSSSPAHRTFLTPEPIGPIGGAAAVLLELCRARASGVVVFKNRLAEGQVALLRGVPVGATDNGHDNRLGPRLQRRGLLTPDDVTRIQEHMQENGGRVGEAVLALGVLSAGKLLEELRLQSQERLVQICGWAEGEAHLVRDDAKVIALAVDAFDIVDAVLRSRMRDPDEEEVARFMTTRGHEAVSATPDFEEGLVAYAGVAPRSPLPLVLMSASTSVSAVLKTLSGYPPPDRGTYASHLYALWQAGLVRLAGDPPRDGRAIPRPWKPEQVASDVIDAEAIEAVQRAWLRIQGLGIYDALGVARDAPAAAVESAIAELDRASGPARVAGRKLGPAEGIARDIALFLDEARATLLDPDARAAYDARLARAGDPEALLAAEEAFLAGKLALQGSKLDEATDAFARAHAATPNDAELLAWLGWARFLDAAERLAEAVAMIKRARHENPAAARPLLFLAQVSEQQGDLEAAKNHVRDALRRCPDDPDVERFAARLLKPS